ncbi:fibronectin type III domain-containing protein [Candidatus Poribacteria bacterium]|nr:fibronectin type III domain-containing protein [Candidatus Poribacteria bacterium]
MKNNSKYFILNCFHLSPFTFHLSPLILLLFLLFGCGSQKHENPFSPENIKIYEITPTGFAVTPADGEVVLRWDLSNDEYLDHYIIYRNTIGLEGTYTDISKLNKNVALYKDKGLKNGTTYYYKLVAVNARYVEGKPAGPLFCTPVSSRPPDAPKKIILDARNNKNFLHWDFNKEMDLKGYNIYRNNLPKGEFKKINSVSPNINSYFDTSLNNGEKYYYRVTACNLADLESFYDTTILGIPFAE